MAGLSTFYQQTQGLSADKAKKFAVCMVDEMYDKAKTATLEAMRDGDTTKIAMSDAGLVAEAGFTCQPCSRSPQLRAPDGAVRRRRVTAVTVVVGGIHWSEGAESPSWPNAPPCSRCRD